MAGKHAWLALRHGWLALGPKERHNGIDKLVDKWMDEQIDQWTENLPILQDFVPYRSRYPASPHENQGESRAGQGNR